MTLQPEHVSMIPPALLVCLSCLSYVGLAFSATRFRRSTATKSHAKGVHSFLEPLPPVWSFPATVIHVLVLGGGCRNRDHGQHPQVLHKWHQQFTDGDSNERSPAAVR